MRFLNTFKYLKISGTKERLISSGKGCPVLDLQGHEVEEGKTVAHLLLEQETNSWEFAAACRCPGKIKCVDSCTVKKAIQTGPPGNYWVKIWVAKSLNLTSMNSPSLTEAY